MAITVFSDIKEPKLFAQYALEQAITASAVVKSGIVVQDAVLSAALAGGGSTFNFPSWRHTTQDATDANVASFDPTDRATPEKLTANNQVAVRLVRNRSYSAARMAGVLAGSDPLAAAQAYIGERVAADRQAALMSIITGVAGADAGLVNDSLAAFSMGGLLETVGLWGDRATGNVALAMNSKQRVKLQIANATAYIPASLTPVGMDTYLGMPVIVDDKIADGEVIAIEMGAISLGVAQHAVPFEVERDGLAANGDGVDTVIFRDVYSFHVEGAAFVGSTATGLPTNTVLATAANWDLAAPAKAVGVLKYKFTA